MLLFSADERVSKASTPKSQRGIESFFKQRSAASKSQHEDSMVVRSKPCITRSDFSLQKSSNKVGRKQWIWTFNSFLKQSKFGQTQLWDDTHQRLSSGCLERVQAQLHCFQRPGNWPVLRARRRAASAAAHTNSYSAPTRNIRSEADSRESRFPSRTFPCSNSTGKRPSPSLSP